MQHVAEWLGQCSTILTLLVFHETELLIVSRHDERYLVGRVCSVGLLRLGVDHLLSVSVVGSDEQNVARLLACLVDDADSLVSVLDGLNGSIIDTSVANLFGRCQVKTGI